MDGKWRVERNKDSGPCQWVVKNPRGQLAYVNCDYVYALRFATDPVFRHICNPDNWYLTT